MTIGFTLFLIVVAALIVIYIYTLLQILRLKEEEFTLPSKEDQLRSKMTEARAKENIAWIFLLLGAITEIIGFFQASFQNSLFFIIFGGCIIVVSFFTTTHYRKERSKYVHQLNRIRTEPQN